MPHDLKESLLRAIQYFYVDGTYEFGFGLLCLILAGYFYAEAHVSGWLSAIVDASLVLVMIGGGYLIQLLIRRLKERLTWPRTGYVSYQRKQGIQRGWRIGLVLVIGGVIGGVVASATTMLVMNQDIQIAVMPLISGLLLGMVMVILGWRTSIPRFYIMALLSAALGVTLAYSGLENSVSLIAYYASLAVVQLFTGTCVLSNYLRQNPLQKESPDEH